MFKAAQARGIDRKWALIEGEPKIVLYDDVPILYTGKNSYGNRVIGKSVTEDYEHGIERYIHIIVNDFDYRRFHLGRINYLDLLKDAEPIFVVDKSVRKDDIVLGITTFAEIPEELRPTEYSFFPTELITPSIEYSTKIAGGLADESLAFPDDVGVIQKHISEFLRKSLHTIETKLGFTTSTKLRPATVGSYEINFHIDLAGYPQFYVTEGKLLRFVNSFSEYCFENLPSEIDKVIDQQNLANDGKFEELFAHALELIPLFGREEDVAKERESLKASLRKDVLAVPLILAPVAEVIKKNYVSLALDSNELPLGTIDHEYSDQLEEVIAKLNKEVKDEQRRDYKVMVYSLNKQSGKGKANVLIDDTVSTIGFFVKGIEAETADQYIESMKQDKYITVQGFMTFHGEKPHYLDIA